MKDYNMACFVGNAMHLKRAMVKQYPKKGVIEQPRAEYSKLKKLLNIRGF